MKKRQKRADPFFSPDNILTKVHQAVVRDLRCDQHESIAPEDVVKLFKDNLCDKLRKKFVNPDEAQEELEKLTYEKFLKVNEHMAHYEELNLPHLEPGARPKLQRDILYRNFDAIHLRARALLHWVLEPFTEEEWHTECKHSSGASLGVSYKDTSPEKKFSFPISMTSDVKPLFDQHMSFDLDLKLAVQSLNDSYPFSEACEIVEGSRATTVEKDNTIRRLIAVEPTGNMYFQQGLMAMIYRRMRKVGLDVGNLPDQHRLLAMESSITGSNATIDWTSASDCVSIELLRWLIPPKWFSAINRVRCEKMSIMGTPVKLNMISTMGNAVTFPLETLVFWAYAQACCLHSDKTNNSLFPEWEDLKRCSVFGDDCILPCDVAPLYIEVMTSVGFIVNNDKSFYDGAGRFRESCGGDYLQGFNVRPVYLRGPTSTKKSALEPWLYIIFNSLHKKYISYFGELKYVYDRELYKLMFGYFRKFDIQVKLVPDFFPDDAGLKMSDDILRIANIYRPRLSRIDVSEHGTLSFRFCNFRYWKKQERHDDLRYAMWLKRPRQAKEPKIQREIRPLRKKGGYVVAKGLSCHWQIPGLEARKP